MKEFFTTLQGKVITALTIIALILGIAAEGVSMYRNAMEGETAAETAHNAAKLRVAEAEERTQLAKKAAFEAEMAKAAADNAAKLKLAEAEERTQLAKKAAADAETALATAKYADTQKAADAELTRQKDRSETANADINEVIANTIAGGPGWHRDATALTAPKAFGGGSPAPATTTEPDQPTQKTIEDCKRRLAAFNETLKDHAAFAMSANGGCAWRGQQPSIEEAVRHVMQQCANAGVHTCKIVARK